MKTTREEIDEIKSKLLGGESDLGKLRALAGEMSAKIETVWAKVFGKGKTVADLTNSDTIRGAYVYAHSEGSEPNIDATGAGMAGYPITFGTIDVHLFVTNDGVLTFGADTSGNVRAGSNASVAATTAWAVFSIDQTYNSESLGAGDMLLGDNSSSKANILWDASAGQLKFRSGTTTKAYIDTDGTLVSTDAEIGGWTIDATTIQKLTASVGIILDSANRIIKVGNTAGNHIQIDGANNRIRSSNYAANATGFDIDGATGDAEFNNITARGAIKTAVFEKDTISAVGGTMLILPGDVLATDMTAADNSTLTVSGEETFAVGDILRMKDGTNDEWLEVTSIASAPTYAVTRDKAAAYASNSNPAWKAGQAVANYMKSGDGGVMIVSGSTPKISCFTHAGSPWTTITEQSYMSELGNIAGAGAVTLDENGVAITASTSYADLNAYKFISSVGATISSVGAYITSIANEIRIKSNTSSGKSSTVTVTAEGDDSVGAAAVRLQAYNSSYGLNNGITMESSAGSNAITINDGSLDIDTFINGSGGVTTTFDAGTRTQTNELGMIINNSGADSDTQVKGTSGENNLLRLDASTNRGGIKTASPSVEWDVNGTIKGTGLIVGGATLSVIDEGTYTPTITGVTNVAASTAQTCFYMRVGTKVTVWGGAAIDPTAAGNTVFGISLPVASNLALARNLVGNVGRAGAGDEIGNIEGDATNDRANVTYTAAVTANHNVHFQFSYTII